MSKTAKNKLGCPEIKRFRLEQLRPAPYNPREISDDALEGLAASLKKFGCVEPIVVNIRNGKNIIVGGNQRFKVLSAAGVKECICVAVDLSEADEKTLNLTLNNPEIQGQFIAELESYIEQLRSEISNSDFVNLRIAELSQQIGGDHKIGLTDDDEVPDLPKKAITKTDDIWQLGDHRLLCGNSTEMRDLLKLMGRKKAKMCFTSPPYNMAGDMYEHYKDSMKSAQYISFNLIVAGNIKKVLNGFLFWNISYNVNSRWEFIEIFYRLIKVMIIPRVISPVYKAGKIQV